VCSIERIHCVLLAFGPGSDGSHLVLRFKAREARVGGRNPENSLGDFPGPEQNNRKLGGFPAQLLFANLS
jgi:hypothetical protein